MFCPLYGELRPALWGTLVGMRNSSCGSRALFKELKSAIPCNTTPYNTKPVKFRAPVKELEWTNMGLGFLRTTRRASETQILENWSL